MKKSACFMLTFLLAASFTIVAQKPKEIKWALGEHQYVKLSALSQFWARDQALNPGSKLYGYPQTHSFDLRIRRCRIQLFAELNERTHFYLQLGENNFNHLSDRKLGLFLHDASADYAILKNKLQLGAGLTGWSGFARFSAPSVGSIMGIDAPLYLQATNDVTDQFLRKLTIYAKGTLGHWNYRVALADPLVVQKSATQVPATPQPTGNFSQKPPKRQWSTYWQYQFKDKESQLIPYATGTYLGEKNVCNIGAGVVYQPKAIWYLSDSISTQQETALLLWSVDFYLDRPLGKGAIHCYANFAATDFGPDYVRNLAVMNPVNGTSAASLLNGAGNGFPAYGTGNTYYAQIGYWMHKTFGFLDWMPYVSLQHSEYQRLKTPMNFYDMGSTFFLAGHSSKITLAYQSRPVYQNDGALQERKGALLIQYQVLLP
jgi:hypothetical protein